MDQADIDDMFGTGKIGLFPQSERRVIFKTLSRQVLTASESAMLSRVRTKLKIMMMLDHSILIDIIKDKHYRG